MPEGGDKRERLVDAAADLFWRAGYDATSLAAIAKAAGVPLGNVYYYFHAKVDLAAAVAELFVAALSDALAEIDRSHDDAVDRLDAFFALLAAGAGDRTRYGCPIARLVRDLKQTAPGAAERAGEVFVRMENWLAATMQAGGAPREAARSHSRIIIVTWQGAIVLAQARDDRSVLETMLASQCDAAKAAVRL